LTDHQAILVHSQYFVFTRAENERTILAKDDNSNKKSLAINAAHIKRGTTTIGFAQRGRNAAYSLGSAFNRTIKKFNENKHISFATHNEVYQYTNTEQHIMVTCDSDADGHYISEKDRCNAGLTFCNNQHKRWESPMEAQAKQHTSPTSRSDNSLLKQCGQTHSRTSPLLL
jgi:hypothetical protein